jgi:hypothetical protein
LKIVALCSAVLTLLGAVAFAAVPEVSIVRAGDDVMLTWSGGVLQSATKVDGSFTDLIPQPQSPWAFRPTAMGFFRVREGFLGPSTLQGKSYALTGGETSTITFSAAAMTTPSFGREARSQEPIQLGSTEMTLASPWQIPIPSP